MQRMHVLHTPVYALADCLRMLLAKRAMMPSEAHLSYNLPIIILGCSFLEASLSRGLLEAIDCRLRNPNEHDAAKLRGLRDEIEEGKIYGNPFSSDPKKGKTRYHEAIAGILGISIGDSDLITPATAESVRILFILRNLTVHGQNFRGTYDLGTLTTDPLVGYQPTASKARAVHDYLAKHGLQNSELGAGTLPFLSTAVTNHFIAGMTEFLRALTRAIPNLEWRYAFGAGIAQNYYPYFAGEAKLFTGDEPSGGVKPPAASYPR